LATEAGKNIGWEGRKFEKSTKLPSVKEIEKGKAEPTLVWASEPLSVRIKRSGRKRRASRPSLTCNLEAAMEAAVRPLNIEDPGGRLDQGKPCAEPQSAPRISRR